MPTVSGWLSRRADRRLRPILVGGLGQTPMYSELVVADDATAKPRIAMVGTTEESCLVVFDGRDLGQAIGWDHVETAALLVDWASGQALIRMEREGYLPRAQDGYDLLLRFKSGEVVQHLIDRAATVSPHRSDPNFLQQLGR